ncbi:conserved hypothetical protein [Gammaproteobacteria bacterium]
MLTRIRLQGFKSFEDVEVRFGPFTCIAGANGVGKSNLFDAIQFLRDLTEFPIIEAASRVRDPAGRTGDIRAIFTQGQLCPPDVRIEADFIVPDRIYDDFNRVATPTATFLRYELGLRYTASSEKSAERIELLYEKLTYILKTVVEAELGFPTTPVFRNSAVKSKRRSTPFISTETKDGNTIIQLHQDGGAKGPPFRVPAAVSPKTIVGGINTNDYPTVLAARREMQGWTLFQLEPSALRQPDAFSADAHLASNGGHMAATLLRLRAETEVSNRLANLLDDVGSVSVERDDSRRTYTLHVSGRDGTSHPARSLSDGTLRFLALAILSADPESGRLLCLEEPENGIHPSRISAILQLLREMVVDTKKAVDTQEQISRSVENIGSSEATPSVNAKNQLDLQVEDHAVVDTNSTLRVGNPLRQVIINTHSPVVVSAFSVEDLLVARLVRHDEVSRTVFEYVKDSWRAKNDDIAAVSPTDLLAYVNKAPSLSVEPNLRRTKGENAKLTVREYTYYQMDIFDVLHPG